MKRLPVILLYLLLGAVVNVAVAWECAYFIDPMMGESLSSRVIDSGFDWHVSRDDHFGISEIVREPYEQHLEFLERSRSIIAQMPSSSLWPNAFGLAPVPMNGETVSLPWWYQFPERPNDLTYWLERETLRMAGFPFRSLLCEYNRAIVDFVSQPRRVIGGMSISGGVITIERGGETSTFKLNEIDYIHNGIVLPMSDDYDIRVLPYKPVFFGFMANAVFYGFGIWVIVVQPFRFWMHLKRRIRVKRGLCWKCSYPVLDSKICPECGEEIRKGNPA